MRLSCSSVFGPAWALVSDWACLYLPCPGVAPMASQVPDRQVFNAEGILYILF